eukprot:gene25793-biopygen10830
MCSCQEGVPWNRSCRSRASLNIYHEVPSGSVGVACSVTVAVWESYVGQSPTQLSHTATVTEHATSTLPLVISHIQVILRICHCHMLGRHSLPGFEVWHASSRAVTSRRGKSLVEPIDTLNDRTHKLVYVFCFTSVLNMFLGTSWHIAWRSLVASEMPPFRGHF